MSEKRRNKIRKVKKSIAENSCDFEKDEYFGFIVGYTSNGVPYGLTHEEMESIETSNNENNSHKENDELPF
ncbi:MAG: hypothetical protein ACOC2F_07240 [Bacteroidota bacterium]